MLSSWFLFFKIVSFGILLKLILFSNQFSLLSVRVFLEMKKNFGPKLFFGFLCSLYRYFFQKKETIFKNNKQITCLVPNFENCYLRIIF